MSDAAPSPTWGDLTIGNDGVTWWHPGHGIVAVLPPGATSRPPQTSVATAHGAQAGDP